MAFNDFKFSSQYFCLQHFDIATRFPELAMRSHDGLIKEDNIFHPVEHSVDKLQLLFFATDMFRSYEASVEVKTKILFLQEEAVI